MKKVLLTVFGLIFGMNMFAQESNLILNLKNGEQRLFPMEGSPLATFQNKSVSIGEDVFAAKDLSSMEYSDDKGNLGYFETTHKQETINFTRVKFNQKGAFKIEAEDKSMIVDTACIYETISVSDEYKGRVSGDKLLYIAGKSNSQNPTITFGKFSLSGYYNVYVTLVPKYFVVPEDTLHTPVYLKTTFDYKYFTGTGYSTKSTLFKTDEGKSSFKADTANIETLMVAKAFSIPEVNLKEENSNTIRLATSATSVQYKNGLASREMYIDYILFVPCDEEGNELTDDEYVTYESHNITANFPFDYLKSIQWTKLSVKLDSHEMSMNYGETGTLSCSVNPEQYTNVDLQWTSSDESIARIKSYNRSEAEIEALGVGKAVLTLTDNVTGYKDSVVVTVLGAEPTAGSLLINEIMSANVDYVIGPSFNYDGWIELYNPTDESLILASCYVSDDADNLKKFRLSTKPISIAAHGLFNIWFDHTEDGTVNQVPFKLDCDGGTIYFSDRNGNLITSQEYPQAISRVSYARTADGGSEWSTTANPTPAASNKNSKFATVQLAEPKISVESKFFKENMRVTASAEEGATLIFTYDGSTPTEQNGYVFPEEGIEMETEHNYIFRFRAFKDGYLPSRIVGRSYIGATWDFEELPIISVMTDDKHLWSDELGIFVQGTNGRPGRGHSSNYNTNMDWDRPAQFDYILNDSTVFQQEVGMACCGGWSRSYGWHSSFKLKANKMYDMKKTMDFPFFDAKPYLRNKTLQIRNGGNDAQGRIKDAILQTLVQTSGMDIDGQSYQPTVHFINGSYYGVINMREPNNKDFVYANHGWDSEDIDLFEMGPDSAYYQSCGTKDAFMEWYELSKNAEDAATYEEIKTRVDIDEYINYMALELYLRNWDWPQNNVKAYRHRDGGKFRFVTFDLDGALNNMGSPFTTFEGKKNYTFDKLYPSGEVIRTEIEVVTIFLNLLKNEDFRRQFIDAYCLIGGSVLESSRVNTMAWDLCDRVGNVQYNYEGYNWSPYNTTWNLIDNLSNDGAMSNRTMINYAKKYSRLTLGNKTPQSLKVLNETNADILYNGLKMPTGNFSGLAFLPVELEAMPVTGKRFAGWYDANTDKRVTTDSKYTVSEGSQNVALYPKYYNTTAPSNPVRINEISASNDSYVNDLFKKEDWVEFYNTTDEDIDMAGMYITDNPEKPEKYQIEGSDKISTIIPAHGYKVVWFDKKKGVSQLHASFKLENEARVLYLTAADKSWTDSLAYLPHDADHTIGRYPDGADKSYLMNVVTIEKSNICTSYMLDTADPEPITDIQGMIAQQQFSVSRHGNTITIESSIATEAILNIYSPDGRPVCNERISLNAGTTTYTTDLPQGIYIVHVKSREGRHAGCK